MSDTDTMRFVASLLRAGAECNADKELRGIMRTAASLLEKERAPKTSDKELKDD